MSPQARFPSALAFLATSALVGAVLLCIWSSADGQEFHSVAAVAVTPRTAVRLLPRLNAPVATSGPRDAFAIANDGINGRLDAISSQVETAPISRSTPLADTPVTFGWVLFAMAVGAALSAASKSLLASVSPRRPRNAMAAAAGRNYAGDMQKLSPLRDLILAKVAPAEVKTTGGLVLPDVMQTKPTSADVVAVGPDATALKGGECILYSPFGIALTELEVGGQPHVLLREMDVLGIMPRSPATARDTPELQPLLDRILIRRDAVPENKPNGLIMQSEDTDAKYITGEVVAVGSGAKGADGTVRPLAVQPGQKVLFPKYAGEKLPTPSGPEYLCVTESELLGIL